MNYDGQNNYDNMNDGYNQGNAQGGGQAPNPKYGKRSTGKYIFLGIISIIITIILVISAISFGLLVKQSITWKMNNSGEGQSGSGINGIGSGGDKTLGTNANTDSSISIPKHEGNGADGLTSASTAYGSITEVYMAVSDSVVEISTEIVQNGGWMGQYVSTGAGSGVIIHEDGYIITNNHVIEGASNVTVTLKDGTKYTAAFVGTDEASDIAVIKISPNERALTVARLGCSADLVVGEDVVAIGNPLGSLGGTLTDGIISATERHISINGSDMVLLQTSAAINPGNSGGGLFNMAGQLIGVVNAKAAGDDIEGLGFAIPIDTAHPIVEDIIKYGYVRGVVDHGIGTVDITSQNIHLYWQSGITQTGVYVLSSSYTDEIKNGDKLISVNGKTVSSSKQIDEAIQSCSVGDVIDVEILRGSTAVTVKLQLGEKVPNYVDFG